MSCRDTAAAASTVDIPTGWNPRTKQQPTGLIAYPACGRAVLFESLQVPKPALDLCAHRLMCTQKKSSSVKITLLLKVDLEGFEPLTSRMRTERSPSNIAFVHTLCTVRKEKSTYIRLYKMFRHPNDLSRSQVWSPSRGFSR